MTLPDYRRIVTALPQTIPVLATTATANNRVSSSSVGPNLHVSRTISPKSLACKIQLSSQAARLAWLAEHLQNTCCLHLTVQDAELVATWLKAQGIDAAAAPVNKRLKCVWR